MKTVKNLPAGFAKQKTRSKNFDWDQLLDGNWHILQQGTEEEHTQGKADFISDYASMTKVIKDRARAKNMGVEIAIDYDSHKLALCAVSKKPSKLAARRNNRKGA